MEGITDNHQEQTRRRLKLLHAQAEEWKECADTYQEVRKSLIADHRAKKIDLDYKRDPIEWALATTQHSSKLIELTRKNQLIEVAMRVRHKQEQDELEGHIKQSSLWSGC